MRHGTINDFIRLVEQTPELAREFGALAAKYDFKFVRDQLSDEQLDDVSGGGVTVGVNNLSVVHKGSSGITIAFPDCCYTPGPPGGPTPIPYPNIAESGDTDKGTKATKPAG